MADTSLNAELARLRRQGVTLPRHPGRAVQHLRDGYQANLEVSSAVRANLDNASVRLGRPLNADDFNSPEIRQILSHNQAMSRAMGASRGLSKRASVVRESRTARQERLEPKL